MARPTLAFALALFAGFAGPTACSAATGASDRAPAATGEVRRTLHHGGLERSFTLVVPAAGQGPRPLVIMLHGGATADGRSTMRWGFQPLAARDGVITVHPDGMGEGWNDGRQSGYLTARQGGEVDDVGFIGAMIDTLAAEGLVDAKRVFVVGGSNGGMMALRLACESADRFAAIAPFIAHFPVGEAERCKPAKPMPLLNIVGDADRLMPFGGGPVASIAQGDRGAVISSDRTIGWWRGFNRCTGEPVVRMLPDADTSDGVTLREEISRDCADGAEVVRLVALGGGHRLPALAAEDVPGPRGRIIGAASRDISGPAYIWDFFERHGMGAAAEAVE